MRAIVLAVTRHAFTGEDGREVALCKVHYLGDEYDGKDGRGLGVLNISGGLELWEVFETVPGVYNLEFGQRPGRHGRPVLTLQGAELVESLEGVLSSGEV